MTSAVASAVRPGLRDNRTTSSPHTPTRFTGIGSNFSSPGSTFRQEEDAIIIELGSRYLRAGFEGESGPQCVLPFSGASNKRIGDYRIHFPGYRPKVTTFEEWAGGNELWRNNLGDMDLGLLEDKLERVIREVYNKHLLVDAGTARLVLVVPSIVAHPLLERVLTLLFDRWSYSTITLLPSPTMCAVSAGLRSGLVVDIGWEDTVVTSICEYRELQEKRSTRAMKMLVRESADVLTAFARGQLSLQKAALVGHDFMEGVVMRTAYCEAQTSPKTSNDQLSEQTQALSVSEEAETQGDSHEENATIKIDWPIGISSQPVKLPLSLVRKCVDSTFFNSGSQPSTPDDHEQTLPELAYKALLSLPPDVRGICMSRMMFVGGGSEIPGLSERVLEDIQKLVDKHGWTSVRGQKIALKRKKPTDISQRLTEVPIARHNVLTPVEGKDYIEHQLRKDWAKHALPPQVTGVLREVDSLGAWAGASLATNLKIKGFVEIDKERFLSHGLAGANKDSEPSVIPQRMSSFGIPGSKSNGTTGWTLGQWA